MGNVKASKSNIKEKNTIKENREKIYLSNGIKVPLARRSVASMTTTINTNDKLFTNEIVGMRTLRGNLSECISKAINNFHEIITANAAVKGSKTASIMSTEMLKIMLDSCIKFNTLIAFDEATNQYVVSVPELDADGQGNTREEAIEVLLDNIITLTEDYFENIELYLRIENSKKMLPYFERIRHCENMDDMSRVLGLDQI